VSRTDLPLSVLWHNRQTEAHLILRLKPRNRRGDFDTQITKTELPILRPKPENSPPPWFWGSTKKLTTGFEVKSGETIATSFKVKLEKNIATGFEAKPTKTVIASFEAKPLEIVATGFESNRRKPSEWFWGQTTHKPRSSVLRPKPMRNHLSGFEAKPLTNRRPWLWCSTKELVWQNHLKNAGFCLPRSYRGILDEARMRKHTQISIQYQIWNSS
jgi:hypothetical protein